MSESKTTLAEQLKKLRLAKGHTTARGFARALGISENRYSRYERGEAVPKLDLVWAICAELGITPNELYGWEPGADGDDPEAHGSPHASPGFAESGAGQGLSPTAVSGRPAGNQPVTPSPLDRAAWHLASVLTRAKSARPGAVQEATGRLGEMRATAELFLRLRSDPFEALARFLQSVDYSTLPATAEAEIASEVQAYLAALDAGDQSALGSAP